MLYKFKYYFNLEIKLRRQLLSKCKAAGVKKWFCGHYHQNAGGYDDDLEVVVTSAVGPQLESVGNPLGLPIRYKGKGVGSDICGMRIVKVQDNHIDHQWFVFDNMPEKVDSYADDWRVRRR